MLNLIDCQPFIALFWWLAAWFVKGAKHFVTSLERIILLQFMREETVNCQLSQIKVPTFEMIHLNVEIMAKENVIVCCCCRFFLQAIIMTIFTHYIIMYRAFVGILLLCVCVVNL